MPTSDARGPSIQLAAVGDISFGESAQAVGGGVHTTFERVRHMNAAYPFEFTRPLFAGADVVFGNLETVLSHRGLARWSVSSMEMRGHPASAERLARAGFTVLNVANNHMMQHGAEAFSDTVWALQGEGLAVLGAAGADRQSTVPVRLDIGGLRVTLLGYAFEKDKYAQGPVSYAFGPDCDIVSEVASAKRESDIVLCSMHWGVEFVRHPSGTEERLGREIIDAGAAVVLGHHPHVARRVERYGTGVIAYSLGNFVFDMNWSPWLRTGLVLRAEVTPQGVRHWTTDLVWIGDDYQPRPLDGTNRAAAQEALASLSHPPDWTANDATYFARYEELVATNRHESYRHFLRTVTSRPVSYSVQTLLLTARRKAMAALNRA
jgi:poly-gamma-glutamate synthesis protein (capsule biosynthesis protein)